LTSSPPKLPMSGAISPPCAPVINSTGNPSPTFGAAVSNRIRREELNAFSLQKENR